MPRFSIERGGCASSLSVTLQRGDTVKAEPDALVTMSANIEVGAALDGGLLGGIMRKTFSGESLFVQTLRASRGDGDAMLCAAEIGDLELISMARGEDLMLAKGAFVASSEAVDVSTAVQRSMTKSLFAGTGLFLLRAATPTRGDLVISAHGKLSHFTLAPGEVRAVDNGHLVAWSAEMPYEVRLASSTGGQSLMGSLASSVTSGEGLMCFFTGPGRLWLQTHKPPPPAGKSNEGGASRGSGGGFNAGLCLVCMVMTCFAVVATGIAVFSMVGGSSFMGGGGGGTFSLPEYDSRQASRLGGSHGSRPRSKLASKSSPHGRSTAGSYERNDEYVPPHKRGGSALDHEDL